MKLVRSLLNFKFLFKKCERLLNNEKYRKNYPAHEYYGYFGLDIMDTMDINFNVKNFNEFEI